MSHCQHQHLLTPTRPQQARLAEDYGIVSWWSPTKGVESAHLLSCCRRQETGNEDRVGTGQPELRPVLRKPHADMQGHRRVVPVVSNL